jgi:hypothetical protein
VIPPVVFWSFLSLSWFVMTGIASSVFHQKLPLQPRAVFSVGIAVAAALVGAAVLGPLVLLPLAVPPAYVFIRSVLPWRRLPVEGGLRKVILSLGIVSLLCAGAGLVVLVRTLHTRTEAEYICQWASSAPAHAKFQALHKREPASLPEYRYIIQHSTDDFLAAETADRLAEIGDPSLDAPLLQAAIARNRADSEVAVRMTAALQHLRGRATGS